MKNIIVTIFSIFLLTSCGSSETWIVSPYGACESGQANIEKNEAKRERFPVEAKYWCAQSGKSYLNEYKCDGSDILLKCGDK